MGSTPVYKRNSSWLNSIWPRLETEADALRLTRIVSWCVLVYAFVRPLITLVTFYFLRFFELRALLPDLMVALVFMLIAWGLSRHSRVAAWAGLGFYVIERVEAWHSYQKIDWIFTVGCALIFVWGVQATSALRGINQQPKLPPTGPSQSKARTVTP